MADSDMALFKHGLHLQANFEQNVPENGARVGVVMGSRSDFEPCMRYCYKMLDHLIMPYEGGVTSMHRTPDRALAYARTAEARGLKVIIACAGGSAHLPGMMASETTLPVLAVAPKKPEEDKAAVYSTIRMPSGVPAAFIGCGKAGAENAALYAARILAPYDSDLHERLTMFMYEQTQAVPYRCFDF